ncbi:DUF2237 domain-containing protein [Rhodohalobacter sp.]|uniref:DUF2237 family protein n=1 Tax=Rhodohalobacter sp. TaxID=1974210 RepID=UPI002ACEA15B|nr:DUF2237 domain-containing protein [Rhodohalobacter sp.]MDZ7757862.1 DUF2237 domain-containing protein [Rhodohalobacter sp.]
MDKSAKNVFGQPLKECSKNPLTGFYRDGCCHTGPQDSGRHLVCAIMTDEFLDFSMEMGNPLKTPMPQYNFPGLKAGDKWCLCALRWKEAYNAGVAPKIDLEATNEKVLDFVKMDQLLEHANTK